MLSGPALLLLVCLHMRVQGKPRSQVGPTLPLLGPWRNLGGFPIDANTQVVRGALHKSSLSLFWTLSVVRFWRLSIYVTKSDSMLLLDQLK